MATEADRQLAEPMHQQRQRRDSQRGSRRHRQRRRHPPAKNADYLAEQQNHDRPRAGTHTHRQDDRGASPPVVAGLQLLRGREMLMPAAAVFVMNMMRGKSGKRWPVL